MNPAEMQGISKRVFKDTDLIIAQEFMATSFDWRVGVLDRKPLFVCKYFMARDHWQIVKHGGVGERPEEGGSRTLALEAAPPRVLEVATRAASLIGSGLYGVDLKETEGGVFVVEVNDNPNIDAGVEDAVLKDDVYRAVLGELVRRLEKRMQPGKNRGGVSAPDDRQAAPTSPENMSFDPPARRRGMVR
jgi:glutathione synthase/RimK-type ligase-like ATP-grasp enzyme